MPTPTTVHDIDKPLGNENVTRAAYNAVLDEIDAVIRGIIPMTAAQRDALSAGKKWPGRIVYVTDAAAGDEFQRWTGVAWSTDLFPRYSLDTDHAAHRATIRDHLDVGDTPATEGQFMRWRDAGGGAWVAETVNVGVTDHGALTGLADDDHAHYYNQARGDARYSQVGHGHAYAALAHVHQMDAVLLAEVIPGSNVTSVSFTSIPADYRHLLLCASMRRAEAGSSAPSVRFNSDSGNNYDHSRMYHVLGTATAAGEGIAAQSGISLPDVGSDADAATSVNLLIHDYARTRNYRNVSGNGIARFSGVVRDYGSLAGTWLNAAAAINRIDVALPAGNFVATDSIFSLYGLR